MSDCINCKCEEIKLDSNICDNLEKMNVEKVKDTAIVLKHTQPCHWAEETSKGFYGIWCVLQNIITTICYILGKLDKQNEVYDDSALKKRVTDLENRPDKDTIYNDKDVKDRLTALENKPSNNYNDKEVKDRLTALEMKPDRDTIYNDTEVKNRITALENKPDRDTTYTAGANIRIEGNVISATVPAPDKVDLTGYVKLPEFNQLKNDHEALKAGYNNLRNEFNQLKAFNDKIIANLRSSGAWNGGLDGNFNPNRNIATGNINIFGGTPDGNSFIRTNNGQTENDLAGGI